MSKIAVDIALLLPEAINMICIDINQKEYSEKYSDLSKSDNHPHITMAMGVIDKNDIEEVNNKLQKVVKNFSKLDLEIIKTYHQLTPENKISYGFEIKLTDEIKKLHGKIMKDLLPMFSYNVTSDMFFLDSEEKFSEVSKVWVESYGVNHSNPDNYHPHISLKCRKAEYNNFPEKFIASKVAFCHLGNYCTCRTIFGLHELS
jgi:2'-5' RNA ligase